MDEYFAKLKSYVLVDCKTDWQSCTILLTSITTLDNAMNYSVWVTHRDNYQDTAKPNAARTNLIKYMKQLQLDMNLEFVKAYQSIKLVDFNNSIITNSIPLLITMQTIAHLPMFRCLQSQSIPTTIPLFEKKDLINKFNFIFA